LNNDIAKKTGQRTNINCPPVFHSSHHRKPLVDVSEKGPSKLDAPTPAVWPDQPLGPNSAPGWGLVQLDIVWKIGRLADWPLKISWVYDI